MVVRFALGWLWLSNGNSLMVNYHPQKFLGLHISTNSMRERPDSLPFSCEPRYKTRNRVFNISMVWVWLHETISFPGSGSAYLPQQDWTKSIPVLVQSVFLRWFDCKNLNCCHCCVVSPYVSCDIIFNSPSWARTEPDHVVRLTRPSGSVFAYCKRSKTGAGEGLGTRLIFSLWLPLTTGQNVSIRLLYSR